MEVEMPLKPQNIVQAAEADLKRKHRNAVRAGFEEGYKHACPYEGGYEQYAFHRKHVRRASTAHQLLVLALADPTAAEKTAKANTRMIYRNAGLLLDAISITRAANADCSPPAAPSAPAIE
jgi:hypothetical protein